MHVLSSFAFQMVTTFVDDEDWFYLDKPCNDGHYSCRSDPAGQYGKFYNRATTENSLVTKMAHPTWKTTLQTPIWLQRVKFKKSKNVVLANVISWMYLHEQFNSNTVDLTIWSPAKLHVLTYWKSFMKTTYFVSVLRNIKWIFFINLQTNFVRIITRLSLCMWEKSKSGTAILVNVFTILIVIKIR